MSRKASARGNLILNMEQIVVEKFNASNFFTWKVKFQMNLMHQNLWSLVKRLEPAPQDPKQLVEWQKREERAKSIIGLSLSNSQLHLINLRKSSSQIWEHLSKIFGEKAMNAKFPLKLQLFKLNMHNGVSLSTHINHLKLLIRQLEEIDVKVEEEDAKAILLNSLPSNYDNAIFTLSQFSSGSLDEMFATLLAEEKRMKLGNTEDNSHDEMALFSKGRVNKNRDSVECFYCRRHGNTTFNCKSRARNLLNGKLKESANIATIEDLHETNLQDFLDCDNDNEFDTEPLMLF